MPPWMRRWRDNGGCGNSTNPGGAIEPPDFTLIRQAPSRSANALPGHKRASRAWVIMLSVRPLLAWFPCAILTVAVAWPPIAAARGADDVDYEGKQILNIRFSPAEQPLEAS